MIVVNFIVIKISQNVEMNVINLNKPELLEAYVAICNTALLRNCERFPFKQILEAASNSARGRLVEVEIKDSAAKKKYIFTIENGRIVSKEHDECGECECDDNWLIPQSYINDVVENPDDYINNPARIDWSWLYA